MLKKLLKKKPSDLVLSETAEAADHLKPHPVANYFFTFVLFFFVWLFVWASFSKIDITTRGTGQVAPSSEIQYVQSLEGGILTELLVYEGQQVTKDQILARMDDVHFSSEEKGTEAALLSLMAKRARLKAEADNTALEIPPEVVEKRSQFARNETQLFEARQRELNSSLAILKDQIIKTEQKIAESKTDIERYKNNKSLLEEETEITKKLTERGALPKIELIQKQRELNDTSGLLQSTRNQLSGLEAELRATTRKLQERREIFQSEARKELNSVETEIAKLQESLVAIEDRVDRTDLRSPVDGIIKKIHVKTIGGVIQPAMRLVEIVPIKDDLIIKSRIKPADVAFLYPGQDVKIRITAYDSQIYGSLNGKLERISADTVKDSQTGDVYFETDIRTEKNYLGSEAAPLLIMPGMIAETDIITGKRTILSYILKPVLRAKELALKEK